MRSCWLRARLFHLGRRSCRNRSDSCSPSRPDTPSCRARHSACRDYVSDTCRLARLTVSRGRTSTQHGTYLFLADNPCGSTVGICSCPFEGRWNYGDSLRTYSTINISTSTEQVSGRLWNSTRWHQRRSPLGRTGCGETRTRAKETNGCTIRTDCSLDPSAPATKRARLRTSKLSHS